MCAALDRGELPVQSASGLGESIVARAHADHGTATRVDLQVASEHLTGADQDFCLTQFDVTLKKPAERDTREHERSQDRDCTRGEQPEPQ